MKRHELTRRNLVSSVIAVAIALSAATLADCASSAPSATPLQRADELLRKMTIEEKAMQLSSVYPMGLLDAQLKHGIGHVAGLGAFGHKTPETIAQTVNAIQRYLVTETRLKIPAIFHNEALNGVVAPHFTHFPTAIALAATWDPKPWKRWQKSNGARCGRWACSRRWHPSWTSLAMPVGDGCMRPTERTPTSSAP